MTTSKKPSRPKAVAPARSALIFKPVSGTRPAEEIMAQIRAHLAARTLKAGDRLPSERELAEQFAVSRNSVRQASRSLVELGLLEIRKGASGGAFIHEGGGGAVLTGLADLYSLGTIRPEHLTEVRIMLAVEVARLACERCTTEEIEDLETNVARATEAADVEDFELRMQVNLDFHKKLALMTRNPILVALTDAIVMITEQFVRKIGPTSNRSVMPVRSKILKHLRNRDGDAAAHEMRSYLLRLQSLYLKAIK
ncbi:FadR/GntR family transcriptional regulator [soil metagenome]